MSTDKAASPLEVVAREFVEHYTKGGGCGHCGGVPHTSTCFVGRCAAALSESKGCSGYCRGLAPHPGMSCESCMPAGAPTGIDWSLTHERCPQCLTSGPLGQTMAIRRDDGARECLKCRVRLEAFAPCPQCGGMGETTHDVIVGGTEHDTEQRECDACKGTGVATKEGR